MFGFLKQRGIFSWAVTGLWLAAIICPGGQALAEAPGTVPGAQEELVRVKVYRLVIDSASQQPGVVLVDAPEKRGLFIWIAHFEANAIHSEMQGIKHFRPLTHDLLQRVIERAHLAIQRVVITHIHEGVYYAKILMGLENGVVEIDARPSDSIVMALKFKAPIWVTGKLWKEASVPLQGHKEVEERYGITAQDLNPSLARAFSFGSTEGVLISDVKKGSSAEKDGLKRGDILVEIADQAIKDMASLRQVLESHPSPAKAKIFRKNRFLSVTLHPG